MIKPFQLGFKYRYEPDPAPSVIKMITGGRKIHTLRNPPKHLPRIGTPLELCTYLDGKPKPFATMELKSYQQVNIRVQRWKDESISFGYRFRTTILIEGRALPTVQDYQRLMYNDGFTNSRSFTEVFVPPLPDRNYGEYEDYLFEKIMYHWTELRY